MNDDPCVGYLESDGETRVYKDSVIGNLYYLGKPQKVYTFVRSVMLFEEPRLPAKPVRPRQ